MASAIGSAIKAVAAWYAGLGAASQIAVQIIAATAASAITSRLSAKKIKGDGPQFSKDATVTDTVYPHVFVYGEAAVGGLIHYSNVRNFGEVGPYLYISVTHAAHLVEDIVGVYFEDDHLTSEIDWPNNVVSSGKYRPAGTYASVELYRKFGTDTQTAFSELTTHFGSDITAAHQGKGRCHVLYVFLFQGPSKELFEHGQPRKLRALIKGHLVYDPRKDDTNGGTGDHRLADDTTWEWSENPILCACDYMRRYMGVGDNRIDWPSISEEADHCDVSVSVPGGTQNRYTCNGSGNLATTHGENLNEILTSCYGTRVKVNGKFRLLAGRYRTPDPAVDYDESDVAGQVVLRSILPERERRNTVGSLFFSKDHQHYDHDALPLDDAGYIARDGKVIRDDLKLPYTNEEYQAQRIQWFHLHQSDQQKVVTVPLKWTGLRLSPGAGATFSYDKYSFVSKTFRCLEWALNYGSDAPFTVTLREDEASAWDDPEVGDYKTKNAQGSVSLTDPQSPQPANATATGVPEGIQVEWELPPEGLYTFVRVYASATSAWAGASEVFAGRATSFFHALDPGVTRYYWIVAYNLQGGEGTRNPDSDTSTLTATSLITVPPGVTNAINRNPDMGLSSWVGGIYGPAGYITNSNGHPGYEDNSAENKVLELTTASTINMEAIRNNPDTEYEILVTMKTADSASIDIRAEEYDSELSESKMYLGSASHAGGMQLRTRLVTLVNDQAVSTSYVNITATYVPTSTCKYFSISIWGNGVSETIRVRRFLVRDKSTLGAKVGTNLKDTDDSVLDAEDVKNDEVWATGDIDIAQFNRDSGTAAEMGPRRSTIQSYKYSGFLGVTYDHGGGGSGAPYPYINKDLEFFKGTELVATLTFRVFGNYGLAGASASRSGTDDLARAVWHAFTEENSSGLAAGDFDVDIGSDTNRSVWDGTTDSSIAVYATGNYGGDAAFFVITVTHTDSGAQKQLIVSVGTIGTVTAIK